MLLSRFLVVSLLYLFYGIGLVAANPLEGWDQFCQSVRTVTVVHTVTHNQPPPSSQPAHNTNPPPSVVTQRPGKVNLGNGNDNGNGDTDTRGNGNTNTKTSSVNNNNDQNTKNRNTKISSTVLPTASPQVSDNNRSFAAPPSSAAAPPVSTDIGNPDTSLTLDPSVIQDINDKAQGAGQTNSLVSSNNFINFCAGKTLTNGKQVKTGSCNPTPIGDIPSVDNMPSAKFSSPKNFDTIPANTPFTIALQVNNLVTGTFTNAANTYFAAPQQLSNGVIRGHSHVTVQPMTSLDSNQPLDPKVFAFFKGLNDVAKNGVLTAAVTNGLPAGVYRISSINSAGNHQEAIGPVAQRGSFNDAIYITVTDDGQQNANTVLPSSAPSVDSGSSAVLPTDVSSDVLSSTSSSSAVPPTVSSSRGGGKDGKNTKTSSSAALPVSTSSVPLDVSPTPTGTGGKKNGVSPSESPVSTSTGRKNGGKGGDVSTSTAPPETTTPPAGDGKPDTKDPTVSSSTMLPDPSPSQGAPNQEDGYPQGGNGPYYKRMHKHSRRA